LGDRVIGAQRTTEKSSAKRGDNKVPPRFGISEKAILDGNEPIPAFSPSADLAKPFL
jgi:hypothetical protein